MKGQERSQECLTVKTSNALSVKHTTKEYYVGFNAQTPIVTNLHHDTNKSIRTLQPNGFITTTIGTGEQITVGVLHKKGKH